MNRRVFLTLAAAFGLVLSLTPARAPGAPPTPAEVDAAIKRGQKFLLKKKQAPGRWETDAARKGENHAWQEMQGSTYGGYTALATYALLASGMSPQDKALIPAIEFLKTADITGTYALGMRAQVWSYLSRTAETQRLLKNDADRLVRSLNTSGKGIGLWDYEDPSNVGYRIDHSASQYGVLGMWAAAQYGVAIEPGHWRKMDEVWRAHQKKDGGWSYDGEGADGTQSTLSMTAAGVATLYITLEFLPPTGLNCAGNEVDQHIENGLRWTSEHFKELGNDNYTWYGIERIGAASGRRYFGNTDWYEVGAKHLLSTQKEDGSWESHYPGAARVPDTAFALLFLARGRAPIVMSKLDYSSTAGAVEATGAWNQRPRDVANVSRWIGRQAERYLGWQVVTLRNGHRPLLEAPILYLAGSEPLELSEADVDTLRRYVEEGGLILGNADCGKQEFTKSFRALGKTLFPNYAFRKLPANHPILVGQQFRADRWKDPVSIEGLSNGSRELMLLIPDADAGKAWQQRADKPREHLFQLGSNIYLYAVDKRASHYRGESHLVNDLGIAPQTKIKVARLEIGKDSRPEPGGWRRLATVVRNEYAIDLAVENVQLGKGQLSPGSARIAHLTGSNKFELNEAQREELKTFVSKGGTLLVDAVGGSSTFAESAERELAEIFAEDVAAGDFKTPIPLKDPLFTNPAGPIERVVYRRTAMEKIVGSTKGPRLRAIRFENNRLGVIFSREDLSTGLVGHAVDGVIGYDPATATAIVRNVILNVAGITKKPKIVAPTGPVGDGLE